MNIKGIDPKNVTGISASKLDLAEIEDGQIIEVHTSEGETLWVQKGKSSSTDGQSQLYYGLMIMSDTQPIAWSPRGHFSRNLEVGKELMVSGREAKTTVTAIIAIP